MTIPHTPIIPLWCKYNAIAAFAWWLEQDALLDDRTVKAYIPA
jgi:hypothetical protein